MVLGYHSYGALTTSPAVTVTIYTADQPIVSSQIATSTLKRVGRYAKPSHTSCPRTPTHRSSYSGYQARQASGQSKAFMTSLLSSQSKRLTRFIGGSHRRPPHRDGTWGHRTTESHPGLGAGVARRGLRFCLCHSGWLTFAQVDCCISHI
jgi:hypothetical protein